MGFWSSGVFLRAVGRAAGKSVQSSFFVSRVFDVATPHCKPCVALCWYVYVSMEREYYLILFGMKYPIKPLPCPRTTVSIRCVGNVSLCVAWGTKTVSARG